MHKRSVSFELSEGEFFICTVMYLRLWKCCVESPAWCNWLAGKEVVGSSLAHMSHFFLKLYTRHSASAPAKTSMIFLVLHAVQVWQFRRRMWSQCNFLEPKKISLTRGKCEQITQVLRPIEAVALCTTKECLHGYIISTMHANTELWRR